MNTGENISSIINSLLVEHSRYGLVLIDSTGRWLSMNPAFTEITGYSLKDVPNGRAWFRKAFPDAGKRSEAIALWQADRKKGVTTDRVLQITCKNGERKWVEMRSSFLPDGTTVLNLHDITDKKLIESAREQAENYYRALLEATPDMVVITDINGHITYSSESAARFLGYDSVEEIIGMNNQDFFADEDKEKIKQIGSIIDRHGHLGPFIARVVRKDGQTRTVEINCSHVRLSGEHIAYIGIMRDITDRLNLENELRQALIEKEILLKEVHHRVKNNLHLIQSLLRLQAENHSSPEIKAVLKDSINRIRAIALLYENLLRSEHPDRIKLNLYLEKIATHTILRYNQQNRKLSIRTDLDEIQVPISAAHPCGLIVSELISNIMKHAFFDRDQGVIEISLKKKPDGKVSLTIRDNGRGLPENSGSAEKDSFGWQIIQDLVDQLDGTISWKSGDGSEISVTFVPKLF
ncbi:MAG: PAS domain S-box protein [Candidatus Saccharicenans sp.]|nr:PAS domain S-box protein [Candidatus Saccharicenans sp.]